MGHDPFATFRSPLILGAGPAGLAMGWRLAKGGRAPTLLEKEKVHGGLGLTFESDGYHFDLGPHVLHPKYPEVLEFIQRIMGPALIPLRTTQQILFRGRYVNYPLRGVRVLTSLPIPLILPAALSFVWARAKLFIRMPEKEISFKEWICNRFGRVLYAIYFGPYVQKVWKIDGGDLSAYVAQQRVPVVSIRDQVGRWLGLSPRIVHAEDGTMNQYYGRYGVGQLVDAIKKEMVSAGGQMIADCEILSVRGSEKGVTSVVCRRNGITSEIPTDFLFSTIPLTNLVDLLEWKIPDHVRAAAQGLDYRAERLVYLKMSRPSLKMPSFLISPTRGFDSTVFTAWVLWPPLRARKSIRALRRIQLSGGG